MYIFSSSLMVSYHMFNSLSHLNWLLYMVRRCVLTSLTFMWLSNFPNTTCWRDFCLLYILASFVKDELTIDVWVFFYARYSVALIPMSVFVQIPWCFDCGSFVILSEVWEGYASCLPHYPQDCFGNSGSFMVLYNPMVS